MNRPNDIPVSAPQQAEAPPLSRIIRIDEMGESEEVTLTANEAERDAIAKLLDLVALEGLSLSGQLNRQGDERIFLRGRLRASVTQTCVVSLEPLANEIEVPVEIEFWQEQKLEAFGEGVDEAAGQGLMDWPEPIIDGKIDLGPLIYESLATAIDPYPRRQDAKLEWQDEEERAPNAAESENPFAILKRLKNRA
jgi:uncharacterized metal-binding protein YceD (DUF177 family)